jgi:putative transposase
MEAWTDSRSPALAIVARGDQIETLSPVEYAVRSQSRIGVTYRVRVARDRWSCECPFYAEAKNSCIHIFAVRFKLGFQDSVKAPLPETKPECERCKSGDVIQFGKRHNRSGILSRYRCKTCGYRFTGRDGYHKRRADPDKIALGLDLYFRGMSLRKIVDHMAQVHSLELSPMTVYRWVTHYSSLAAQWMDAQGARTGERWHVDETVINVNGEPRYLWNVMDADTRFLMATHISKARGLADTRAPLHKAKSVPPDRPVEVFTDGMNSYSSAVKKELGYRSGDCWVNPHHRVPSIRAPESNNLVERLHGSEKERTKVMRAFDNDRGASAIADGFRVHYNMVRTHQALGTTPGIAAGIPDLGGFRWKELIQKAVRREAVIEIVTG